MAQREVNPDSISYNGNTTTITNLRAAIQAGNEITAANINSLIGMINSWDNHTHTYTDRYQEATFGNNGDRALYERSVTSSKHDEDSANISEVSSGDLITAAKHNAMRDVCNKLRSHNHVVEDRTSI